MTDIIWKDESFETIDRIDWHQILMLRQQVFVVEQFCPYPDVDEIDLKARHYYALNGSEIVAYLRLIDRNLSYPNGIMESIL